MFNNYPVNPVLLSPAGRLIFFILDNPGCTVKDLEEALNITGARYGLDILLKGNLVRRESDNTTRGHANHYFIVKGTYV